MQVISVRRPLNWTDKQSLPLTARNPRVTASRARFYPVITIS